MWRLFLQSNEPAFEVSFIFKFKFREISVWQVRQICIHVVMFPFRRNFEIDMQKKTTVDMILAYGNP